MMMPSSLFRLFAVSLLVLIIFAPLPAFASSPEAAAYAAEGDALLAAGSFTAAAEAYERALAIEPGDYQLWDKMADALNRDGKFEEALHASSRALELDPAYARGWINRGQILYNIGYYYEDVKNDTARANGYYEDQLAAFTTATELEPENADAWFNRGYALAGLKRYDDAIRAFDRTGALDPAYPNLAMCRKQAVALRDASLPAHEKYAVPMTIALFIVICGAGIYLLHHYQARNEAAQAGARKTGKKIKKQ